MLASPGFAGYERDSISTTVTQIAASKDSSLGATAESVGNKWCNMAGGLPLFSNITSTSTGIEDEKEKEKGKEKNDDNQGVRLSGQDWVAASTPPPKIVVKGIEIIPSPGAVLVNIPGKLSSLLSPRDAITFNLEHFALLFIADMSQNDSSYRRQNSCENVKRFEEIAMEDPMAMAAALSLAGAGSLVIHR